jgi:hypothetical protein
MSFNPFSSLNWQAALPVPTTLRAFSILCPKTAQSLPAGVLSGAEAVEASAFIDQVVNCPHCGDQHAWRTVDDDPLNEPARLS